MCSHQKPEERFLALIEVVIKTRVAISSKRADSIRRGLLHILCMRTEGRIRQSLSDMPDERVLRVRFFRRDAMRVTVTQTEPILGDRWLVTKDGLVDEIDRFFRSVINSDLHMVSQFSAQWIFKGEGASDDSEEVTEPSIDTPISIGGRQAFRRRMVGAYSRLGSEV